MKLAIFIFAIFYYIPYPFQFLQQLVILRQCLLCRLYLVISLFSRLYVMFGVKKHYMEYGRISVKKSYDTTCTCRYCNLHHRKILFILKYFLRQPVEIFTLDRYILCIPVYRMTSQSLASFVLLQYFLLSHVSKCPKPLQKSGMPFL